MKHHIMNWLLLFLISFSSKQESTGLKHLNDSKAFIEYSNDMDDKNIEEFQPKQEMQNFNCFFMI